MSSQRNPLPWYRTYEDQRLQQQESKKLSAVIAQAEASFESGNYHKLILLIEEAFSENIADTQTVIILKCLLNEALCELSRYEEAAEVIVNYEKENLHLPEKLQAELLLRIGATCSWLAQYPKAIARLNEAIRIFTVLDDKEGTSRGYFELSRLYININEYNIAHDYLTRAVTEAEHLENHRLIAQVLLRLGMVAHYEGNFANAKVHYSKGLKLLEGSHAYRLIGSLQMDLASTLFLEESGVAEQIINLYEKAIENFKILSNFDAMASCYNNLGDALLRFGVWTKAETVLKQAIEIAHINKFPNSEGLALITLGELYLKRGNISEARRLIVAALRIVSDKAVIAHAKRMLGYSYEKGNIAALKAFNTSFQLAISVGDHSEIAFSQLALAEYYFSRQEYEQAAKYLKQVQERLGQKPTPYISGFAQRLTGKMKAVEFALSEAINYLTASISIFTSVGDRYELGCSYLELASLLLKSEIFDKAQQNAKQAKEIFTELAVNTELERVKKVEALIDEQLRLRAKASTSIESRPVSEISLLKRLSQACITHEILLQEFLAIIYESFKLRRGLIFQLPDQSNFSNLPGSILFAKGCNLVEAERLKKRLEDTEIEEANIKDRRSVAGGTLFKLSSVRLPNLYLFFELQQEPLLQSEFHRLELFLEFLKLGLDNCSLRSELKAEPILISNPLISSEPQTLIQGFVYSSALMRQVVEQIKKIRTSDVTVLITGESGTGKELVARAIHAESARREGAFVAFNCTATPRELIESQLFGHRRGSFTGATSNYLGVIRTAKGGTLFLDEIGDLSLEVQPKLLRFLEAAEIQPLGEGRPLKVDVRVIAATNAELANAVAEKRFREDLYHRLNIIRIHIPPLRERADEIPMLLKYYLEYFASRYGDKKVKFSDSTIEALQRYYWPGNVRQLRNEVERLLTYSTPGDTITVKDLSLDIRPTSATVVPMPSRYNQNNSAENRITESTHSSAKVEAFDQSSGQKTKAKKLRDVIRPIEKEVILQAFSRNRGNFTQTAKDLGLSRRGLRLKIDSLDLNISETRES